MRWSEDVDVVEHGQDGDWGEWHQVFEGLPVVLVADVVLAPIGYGFELGSGPVAAETPHEVPQAKAVGVIHPITPGLVVPAGGRLVVRARKENEERLDRPVECIIEGHMEAAP